MTRFISFLLSFLLIFQPVAAYAQYIPGLNLPAPGTMVNPTPAFVPVLIKGLSIDPQNPFQFEFIVDSGNSRLTTDEIKKESERLVKYFLASMTVPEGDLWVNLSPYEKDRIVPDELGKTDLGRDMLAQDYLLKQLTASMIDPEKELGKKFWERVRKLAQAKYGTTDVPMNSFTKVWILPSAATVFEKGTAAYVVESKLKVMTEEDFVASQQSQGHKVTRSQEEAKAMSKDQVAVLKEIVIPEIEKEVNTGRNFAPLRQIYNSLILAKWYKETIKETLLAKVYVDKNKIAGVDLTDKTVKDKIYSQYVAAYKKGVFNYIKEDYDAASDETIPRKYFSGGLQWQFVLNRSSDAAMLSGQQVGNNFRLTVEAQAQEAQVPNFARGRNLPSAPDRAMAGSELGIAKFEVTERFPLQDWNGRLESALAGMNFAQGVSADDAARLDKLLAQLDVNDPSLAAKLVLNDEQVKKAGYTSVGLYTSKDKRVVLWAAGYAPGGFSRFHKHDSAQYQYEAYVAARGTIQSREVVVDRVGAKEPPTYKITIRNYTEQKAGDGQVYKEPKGEDVHNNGNPSATEEAWVLVLYVRDTAPENRARNRVSEFIPLTDAEKQAAGVPMTATLYRLQPADRAMVSENFKWTKGMKVRHLGVNVFGTVVSVIEGRRPAIVVQFEQRVPVKAYPASRDAVQRYEADEVELFLIPADAKQPIDPAMMGGDSSFELNGYIRPNFFRPSQAMRTSRISTAVLLGLLACMGGSCTQSKKAKPISEWSNEELINGLDSSIWSTQRDSARELYRRGYQPGILLAQEKLVWPRIRELTSSDPGYTHGQPEYDELIELGEIGTVPMIQNLRDTTANTDTRKWCAELLGEVGEFTTVFPVLVEVFDNVGGIYEWWHQSEAWSGMIALFARQTPQLGVSYLNHPNYRVRSSVAVALGYLGDPIAVDPLLYVLLNDSEYFVRWMAAGALGDIGDPRAVDGLVTALLNDPEDYVRWDSAGALGKIGDIRAVPALISALLNDSFEYVRSTAAGSLGSMGDTRAVVPLGTALLNDPAIGVRQDAAWALGDIGDAGGVDPLITALQQDSDGVVRSHCAYSLGRIGDLRAVNPLINTLNSDPYEGAREYAAEALGDLRSPLAVEALINALQHDASYHVRYQSAFALALIKDQRGLNPLINALSSETNAWTRAGIARALGWFGDRAAIPALQYAQNNDPDINVRYAAQQAIEMILNGGLHLMLQGASGREGIVPLLPRAPVPLVMNREQFGAHILTDLERLKTAFAKLSGSEISEIKFFNKTQFIADAGSIPALGVTVEFDRVDFILESGGAIRMSLGRSGSLLTSELERSLGDPQKYENAMIAALGTVSSRPSFRDRAMASGEISAVENRLVKSLVHNDYAEAELPKDIDVLMIPGNEDLLVYAKVLDLFSRGIGKHILISGGTGRLTEDIARTARNNGFTVPTGSEAEMIRDILLQLTQTNPAWSGVVDRLRDSNTVILEPEARYTVENFQKAKAKLFDLGILGKGKKVKLLFAQKPIQQLRTKGNFESVFADEISQGMIEGVSFTAAYRRDKNIGNDIVLELGRIILNAQKKDWTLTQGLAVIPESQWQDAADIYQSLPPGEQQSITDTLQTNMRNMQVSESALKTGLSPASLEFANTVILSDKAMLGAEEYVPMVFAWQAPEPGVLDKVVAWATDHPILSVVAVTGTIGVAAGVYAFSTMRTPKTLEGQLRWLKGSIRQRIRALQALTESRNKDVIPHILSMTYDDSSQVRFAAVSALGNLRGNKIIKRLQEKLMDTDADVRSAAAENLRKIGATTKELIEGYAKAFEFRDADPAAVKMIISLFSNLELKGEDAQYALRKIAVSRFNFYAHKELYTNVMRLVDTLIKNTDAASLEFVDMLFQLGLVYEENGPHGQPGSPYTLEFDILRNIAGKESVPVIRKYLTSGHPGIRRSSAELLRKLGWEPQSLEERAWVLIAEENWGELIKMGNSVGAVYLEAIVKTSGSGWSSPPAWVLERLEFRVEATRILLGRVKDRFDSLEKNEASSIHELRNLYHTLRLALKVNDILPSTKFSGFMYRGQRNNFFSSSDEKFQLLQNGHLVKRIVVKSDDVSWVSFAESRKVVAQEIASFYARMLSGPLEDRQWFDQHMLDLLELSVLYESVRFPYGFQQQPIYRLNTTDKAMVSDVTPGGIDMNKIDVGKQGPGVEIKFDDRQMQDLLNGNFGGFAPVIINLVPIPSILPILGLDPGREKELKVSRL